MKTCFTMVILCVLLAVGCAGKPAVVSDPAPAAAAPPVRQITAAQATGQESALSVAAPPSRPVTPPPATAVPNPAPTPEIAAKAVGGGLEDYQDIEAPVNDKGKGEEKVTIADPWEPFNRAMFNFNDKLYFWVLKPAAQGYSKAVPEKARVSVSNFYTNISFPIRFVNSLLQGNLEGAASEFGRFIINTVWGIGGLLDPAASKEINLKKQTADFGQTLGVYGVDQGFYIHWPLLGPSSPRDTVGIVGDIFLYPSIYFGPWYIWTGARVHEKLNDTSLQIGDYEAMKEAAIDPYVAVRDAYAQYRLKMIKHQDGKPPAGVSGLLKND